MRAIGPNIEQRQICDQPSGSIGKPGRKNTQKAGRAKGYSLLISQ
jgi:hypothetical protein